MSVIMKIDGLAEREVVNMSYSLHQEHDVEGRPSAITRGGQISVTLKVLNDGNTELFEWACDPYVSKAGSFDFEKRDGTNMKTLKFEDGYLVDFVETYDSVDASSEFEEIRISAKKIDIGGVFHENTWAD
tara:strand:+ start:20 stop:409 length:390 start_codon:yes stop_codon:yes gene_type:complete